MKKLAYHLKVNCQVQLSNPVDESRTSGSVLEPQPYIFKNRQQRITGHLRKAHNVQRDQFTKCESVGRSRYYKLQVGVGVGGIAIHILRNIRIYITSIKYF